MDLSESLSGCPDVVGPAIVMESSPSLLDFDCASFPGVKIGVGDVPWHAPELCPFDYWVCANTQFPLPWIRRHVSAIKAADARTMVYATSMFGGMRARSVRRALRGISGANNLPPALFYDQRHRGGVYCRPVDGCCIASQELHVGPPIQQLLQEQSPHLPQYSGSSSVVFHGIALALLLGANPIVIAGVTLPMEARQYSHFHFDRLPPFKTRRNQIRTRLRRLIERRFVGDRSRPSAFARHHEEIVEDLNVLSATSLHLGIELFSTDLNFYFPNVRGISKIDRSPEGA